MDSFLETKFGYFLLLMGISLVLDIIALAILKVSFYIKIADWALYMFLGNLTTSIILSLLI